MYHSDTNKDWKITPIGGGTGEAFMGVRQDEKVFFKRNTSPIVAVLSAEGITPKLKWTQRTYSGDVLTAQEWIEADKLKPTDMNSPDVIHLIRHIHQSDNLLLSLKRVQGGKKLPVDFTNDYYKNLPNNLANHHFFNYVVSCLEDTVDDQFYNIDARVCHGDLYHSNFLRTSNGQIYLVDWEQVAIADPISDITNLLVAYYPPSQWQAWLDEYGLKINDNVYKRIQWYSLINCLYRIKQFYAEQRNHDLNETIMLLRSIFKHYKH